MSTPPPIYVTTPIYYVNDVPHIGHAYSTLNADGFARWHRRNGREVFLLTGTDEHGLKIQRAAEDAGRTPYEHATVTSQRFRDAWQILEISYDDFIRTPEERHVEAVQALMQKVYDNGFIYKDTYSGWYCVSCEAYYDESELDPDPAGGAGRCPIHHRAVEWLEEDNYFFKLSAFEDRLREWLDANPEAVEPLGKRNEALGIINGGLADVSASRASIGWGIRVPWDDAQVFYVWFDALINYATAVGYGTDRPRFDRWWPQAHHIVGKDILRFHCVYWPALLMAAGEVPPMQVSVHGYLLVGGEKMSKTAFNQIAPKDLVEGNEELGFAAFGVDGCRYQFLRDVSFGQDGDFSYEGMLARYNADLANTLGNLVSRVAKVVSTKCGGIGPAPDPDSPLRTAAETALAEASAQWDALQPNRALEAAMRLVRETNEYLTANEPWKHEPSAAVDRTMGDALEALRIAALLLSPALVNASRAIWERIGLGDAYDDAVLPGAASWGDTAAGNHIEMAEPLFPRLKG